MMAALFGTWRVHIAQVVFDMDDRGANKPETHRQPDLSSALWAFPQEVLNSKLAQADVPRRLCNVVQQGGDEVDTCQKTWAGLTMMKQNVCHLSMSVRGWGGMSS